MSIRLQNEVYQLHACIEALCARLAGIENRLAALEATTPAPEPRRGPGRPRKDQTIIGAG